MLNTADVCTHCTLRRNAGAGLGGVTPGSSGWLAAGRRQQNRASRGKSNRQRGDCPESPASGRQVAGLVRRDAVIHQVDCGQRGRGGSDSRLPGVGLRHEAPLARAVIGAGEFDPALSNRHESTPT
jgi:hypothetical protein